MHKSKNYAPSSTAAATPFLRFLTCMVLKKKIEEVEMCACYESSPKALVISGAMERGEVEVP